VFEYVVANAFARSGFPARVASPGTVEVLAGGEWTPVSVRVDGGRLVVERGGRRLADPRLDVLLYRVGLRLDDVSVLLRYSLHPVYPGRGPAQYVRDAVPPGITPLYTLPLLYPLVVVEAERVTSRGIFRRRVERGTVSVNPLTLSYCEWRGTLPYCDTVVRRLPPQTLLRLLARVEEARVTPDSLAAILRVKRGEAERILEEAVKYGFAVAEGAAYRITRVTPPLSPAPQLPGGRPAVEWHVFPFTCAPAARVDEAVKLVEEALGERGRVLSARLVFLPYVVVGGVRRGVRSVHAYNVLAGDRDETASRILSRHYECLSLLGLA